VSAEHGIARDPGIQRTLDAVWRIESARIIGTLAKITGDVGLAEDLAQEALIEALTRWPESGVPNNPGAWLTAVAKRRAIDDWRRRERLDARYRTIAHNLQDVAEDQWQPIPDDVLRLVFIACHPVLSREGQVALTLRTVGGLTTEEIARMLLVPVATVQQRIVRAKKTLSAARVPFDTPEPSEWNTRLSAVLAVLYLIFTEGYAATTGSRWIRTEVANEALRLARVLAGLLPREPEVHGLLGLMEFQASRFPARLNHDGSPILLEHQDRSRWDRAQIGRGVAALACADALGRGRGSYCLQAAIAQCHATAPTFQETDWNKIVLLYEALGRLAPNPVVELNHAVAVSMTAGPGPALKIVDRLVAEGALHRSHLLHSVRGELLAKLGRTDEAKTELLKAAALTTNEQQKAVLLSKSAGL
jgi:RNA polymerase sigma factor (sigma-70 family)